MAAPVQLQTNIWLSGGGGFRMMIFFRGHWSAKLIKR